MPANLKAKLLVFLNLRELQAMVQHFELDATDRRSTSKLMQALRSSRRVRIQDLIKFMEDFSESRVKELADLLGVQSTGRRKNALISYMLEELVEKDEEGTEETDDDEIEPLSRDEEEFLRFVPEDGSSIGNIRLRRTLNWGESRYRNVRDALVEKEHLAIGFGRGGSVYRLFDAEDSEEESEYELDSGPAYPNEESLYAAVQVMLERNWQQLFPGFPTPKQHWVHSTPRQGRKKTGGKWTRPDVCAVTVNKYRYLPGVHLDVFTFEVKPRDQFNVLGLYEALGHSRRSNFAYILYHVAQRDTMSEADLHRYESTLEEINREAARLRVGVATFEDPSAAETWTVHVIPGRHDPEARLLDDFIDTFPDEVKLAVPFATKS